MKKVQVIGLPGAGKTTAILEYKEGADSALSYIDISTFSSYKNKEQCFIKAIKSQNVDTIAESACGVYLHGLYIIRLNTPQDILESNLRQRGEPSNKQYEKYLLSQMIPSNYTVSCKQDLVSLLNSIFTK